MLSPAVPGGVGGKGVFVFYGGPSVTDSTPPPCLSLLHYRCDRHLSLGAQIGALVTVLFSDSLCSQEMLRSERGVTEDTQVWR